MLPLPSGSVQLKAVLEQRLGTYLADGPQSDLRRKLMYRAAIDARRIDADIGLKPAARFGPQTEQRIMPHISAERV